MFVAERIQLLACAPCTFECANKQFNIFYIYILMLMEAWVFCYVRVEILIQKTFE